MFSHYFSSIYCPHLNVMRVSLTYILQSLYPQSMYVYNYWILLLNILTSVSIIFSIPFIFFVVLKIEFKKSHAIPLNNRWLKKDFNLLMETIVMKNKLGQSWTKLRQAEIISCEATLDNTQNVLPSLTPWLHHYRNYMLPLNLEA